MSASHTSSAAITNADTLATGGSNHGRATQNTATQSTATSTHNAVVFSNAAVRRGGRTIWQHGNFAIAHGTVSAIVGTNGAGKTTMLQAELGLLPLSEGSVEVLGHPAGVMNQHIGYVPQNYAHDSDSDLTALQSVLLGLTGTRFGFHYTTQAQREEALRVMRFIGIDDKAHMRLSELSGGLRQRVAIAQALACNPQLLILDEPLANLDLASQRATVRMLAKLNREWHMTIQVVAHDLNMLLPILTGAVYLLDGHPHYAAMNTVLDAKLLTHLYGTTVQVITTPQGDMFVTPSHDEPETMPQDYHQPTEVALFHQHTQHEHMHEHAQHEHVQTHEQEQQEHAQQASHEHHEATA